MRPVVELYRHCLQKVHPSVFIPAAVQLLPHGDGFKVEGETFQNYSRLRVLAFGKASAEMTAAFVSVLGADKIHDGLCVGHYRGEAVLPSQVIFMKSSHPFVSDQSFIAGRAVMDFSAQTRDGDLVVVLVSGGASAMVASVCPGIEPKQKLSYINELILQGVGEREVNFVRKSLSQLKGGKLADLLAPARILNLIISDEREHKVTAIASGPTVKNDDQESGLQIVQRYGLEAMTPAPIMRILESQSQPLPHGSKAKISTYVVARREMVLECLKQTDIYDEVVLLPPIEPMPFENGLTALAERLCQLAKSKGSGRYLAISTGELPVIPQPNSKGGRNQHLAMAILPHLPEVKTFDFAALASDGCDFLEGVHGACVNEGTADLAQKNGLDISSLKARTSSYEFHEKLGTLVQGTFSGTNVSDFYLYDFTK